jgi:hypothetical protein
MVDREFLMLFCELHIIGDEVVDELDIRLVDEMVEFEVEVDEQFLQLFDELD